MSVEEKAAQLYMVFGRNVILDNGQLNMTSLAAASRGLGFGVLHDMYAPGQQDMYNRVQQFLIDTTPNKIPVLIVEEGLHGVAEPGKTVFPQPLALASTFDVALASQVGATIGKEARAYSIVQLFAPVIGLNREPRWGRSGETLGEDRHLTSRLTASLVLAMQGGAADGSALSGNKSVVADPKHFHTNSIPLGGHNGGPTRIGKREQLSEFLVPFEVAVAESGARGLMSSYTQVDGIPNCADEWAMGELLREQWGFKGWVIADDGAVHDLFNQHNVSATPADAIVTWMEAGGSVTYYGFPQEEVFDVIVQATRNGTLSEAVLDARVGELLAVKHELGLFDSPFLDVNTLIERNVDTAEARAASLKASTEAIVLLKNDPPAGNATSVAGRAEQAREGAPPDAMLPLQLSSIKKVFVTGPNADAVRTGDYSGAGKLSNFATALDGLRKALGGAAELSYLPGCFVQEEADWPSNFQNTWPIRPAYLSTPEGNQGLLGSYFAGGVDPRDPAEPPVFTRVDPAVDYRWFVYGPNAFERTPARSGNASGIQTALFSARWEGVLTPPVTVDGRISIFTDGNPVQVLINNKTVIDTFSSGGRSAEMPAGCGKALRPPKGMSCSELCRCAAGAVAGGRAELDEGLKRWGAIANGQCKGPWRDAGRRVLGVLGREGLEAACVPDASAPPSYAAVPFVAGEPMGITVLFQRVADTRAQSILEWSLLPGGGTNETAGIASAAAEAAASDVAIVVIGQNDATVGEGIDSGTLRLPGRQEELVAAVAATGTPVVTVVSMGQPLALQAVADQSVALVASFFNGQAYGPALASVLLGDAPPSGRLPSSLPVDIGQLPVFYSQFATGQQPYVNGPSAALFPFGFGLSYSSFTFAIDGVTPAAPTVATPALRFSVTVRNTGGVTSDEVVQLYARDVVASVSTPKQRLVAFARVEALHPGQSQEISMVVDVGLELSVFDRNLERVVEPGTFRFWAGGCSDCSLCQCTDPFIVELQTAADT